jgi:hypothetical protein
MEFLFVVCERICLFLACMHTCGILIHLHCGSSFHWISLAHLLRYATHVWSLHCCDKAPMGESFCETWPSAWMPC